MYYNGDNNNRNDNFQFDFSQLSFNMPFQIPQFIPQQPPPPPVREEKNGVKYLGVTKTISTYTGEVAYQEEARKSLKEGDKMILPEEVLIDVTQRQEMGGSDIPKVMIFEVSNKANTKKAYGGVLQFSRESTHAYIPRWMFYRLTDDDDKIELELNYRYISVPNATMIKLLPHSKSFYDQNNPKAILELILSKFTVLYKGLTFEVPSPSNSKELLTFEVVEVSPKEVGCIVDQDVQVDFAENKELFPDVKKSPPPSNGLAIDAKNNRISISNGGDDDDDDDSNTDSNSYVSKGGQGLSQSPVMFKDKGHSLTEGPSTAATGSGTSAEQGESGDLCENCGKRIPTQQMRLHLLRCRRIYMRCPKCNTAVMRSALEDHNKEFHTEVKCEKCNGTFADKKELEGHLCPYELVLCEYCGINVVRKEIDQHTEYCGSRTEACEVCGATVTKRDMKLHLESNCTYPPKPKSPQRDQDDGYDAYHHHGHRCKACNNVLHDFEEAERGICANCTKTKLSVFMIDDGESMGGSYCSIYYCPICNEMFNELQFFTEHIKLSKCFKNGSSGSGNEYVCKRCGSFRGDYAHLVMHFSKCVPNKQPQQQSGTYDMDVEETEMLSCPHCNNVFFGPGDLEAHKYVCPKAAVKDDDDDDDMGDDDFLSQSIGRSDNVCPFCSKIFRTSDELSSHVYKCDMDPDRQQNRGGNSGNRDNYDRRGGYECPFCGKGFPSEAMLENHVYKCTEDPDRKPPKDDSDYLCNFCQAKFRTPTELVAHSYDCPKAPDNMAKTAPPKSPPPAPRKSYECPLCKKRLSSEDEMNAHIKQCSLDMIAKENGQKGKRADNTTPIIPYAEVERTEKEHSHRIKGFFFKSSKSPNMDPTRSGSSDIDDEMNTGNVNGSMDFHVCKKCGEMFDSRRSFIHHQMKCGKKKKGMYACPECHMEFNSSDQLERHKEDVHNVD